MLARVYIQGQLSDVHRKTLEGIALKFGIAPRTLQRFMESSKWDEEKLHDRSQQTIAKDYAHPEAIGKGPEVWEIKWHVFWRKGENGLPGRRHCLTVARNVLTQEVKYFLANRVPGERGITLRWLLRVAFGRWPVERCFRVAKDVLGMDHYQVRGWRCWHRHFYLTQVSYLFCARIRQKYDKPNSETPERLTIEQVCSAVSDCLSAADLKPTARRQRHEKNEKRQRYYRRRNRQAGKSHTKTKIARFMAMKIDVNQIKSCIT